MTGQLNQLCIYFAEFHVGDLAACDVNPKDQVLAWLTLCIHLRDNGRVSPLLAAVLSLILDIVPQDPAFDNALTHLRKERFKVMDGFNKWTLLANQVLSSLFQD